jgi:hypothetical protein
VADQIREPPACDDAGPAQQAVEEDRPTEPSPVVQAVLATAPPACDCQPIAGNPSPADVPAPRQLVRGWKELCSKVDLKYTARRMLNRLNALQRGPIRTLGKGRPPEAWVDELIPWWNDLENRHAAIRERQESAAATIAGGFEYGRGSEKVIPEVAMHVRKRRMPKMPEADAG